MSIAVSVRHRLGDLTLEVDFTTPGNLTAVFGASGSGKSTLINIIAGLLKPAMARISVAGQVLADTDNGIWVPPWRRQIGYVFQDARLFPHLSVEQNLRYGHWIAAKGTRGAAFDDIIAMLGIGHLLKRQPQQLSGGEAQRVAIGRALLAAPRLLLMDEPLASLDQPRKDEILPYIETLRDSMALPVIYVSHSIAEVARLAQDVVVLADGKVTAFGKPASIISDARLLAGTDSDEAGMIMEMQVKRLIPGDGLTLLEGPAGQAYVTGTAAATGSPVRLRLRSRDVMIATSRPKNLSALNVFEGAVTELRDVPPASVEVHLNCGGTPVIARITRYSAKALGLKPGAKAYAIVKTVSVMSSGAGHT